MTLDDLSYYGWKLWRDLKTGFLVKHRLLEWVRRRTGYYDAAHESYDDGHREGFDAGVESVENPPIVRDWLDMGLVPVTADQVNPYYVPSDRGPRGERKYDPGTEICGSCGQAKPTLTTTAELTQYNSDPLPGIDRASNPWWKNQHDDPFANKVGLIVKKPAKKTKRARRKK